MKVSLVREEAGSLRGDGWKTTATAKEEADPCGMTTRKAKATARATARARAREEADPCGMTTRKARAGATARARARARKKQIPAG